MLPKINRFLATSLLSAAAIAAVPSVASADHRFDNHRDDGRDDRRDWHQDDHRDDHRDAPSSHVDIRIGGGSYERVPAVYPPPVYQEQVWVAPLYRSVTEQVLVPATYTTVVDRVWVEPLMQHSTERIWIADRYENRDVTRWENGQRVTRSEQVLVEPGHYADVPRDVVVTPGHYEDRPRQQLACAEHYESVTRQELVVPGHYETVSRFAAVPVQRDSFSLGLRIPFGH